MGFAVALDTIRYDGLDTEIRKMNRVGDYEHVRIVKYRLELRGKQKGEPISMNDMANKLGRSSATVLKHINYHNNMVHSVASVTSVNEGTHRT